MSIAFLPTIIKSTGKYKTRCGEVVTITAFSPSIWGFNHGEYSCGTKESWRPSGRLNLFSESRNDIVEKCEP